MVPVSLPSERGVYARMMELWVVGSWRRIIRCWPTGRPMVWVGWERVKEKIFVSRDICFLEVRRALVQVLGRRKMGDSWEGSLEEEGVFSRATEVDVREPMWYSGIIALAFSLSG